MDKECDVVMKMNANELKELSGGNISMVWIIGTGGVISFLIGILAGVGHPKEGK